MSATRERVLEKAWRQWKARASHLFGVTLFLFLVSFCAIYWQWDLGSPPKLGLLVIVGCCAPIVFPFVVWFDWSKTKAEVERVHELDRRSLGEREK